MYSAIDNEKPVQIARKFGISCRDLIAINKPHHEHFSAHAKLYPGTAIILPLTDEEQLAAQALKTFEDTAAVAASSPESAVVLVGPGDQGASISTTSEAIGDLATCESERAVTSDCERSTLGTAVEAAQKPLNAIVHDGETHVVGSTAVSVVASTLDTAVEAAQKPVNAIVHDREIHEATANQVTTLPVEAAMPPPAVEVEESWREAKTSEGKIYYYKLSTGESRWDKPPEPAKPPEPESKVKPMADSTAVSVVAVGLSDSTVSKNAPTSSVTM